MCLSPSFLDNYRDMLEQLAAKQHILAMASRQTQVVSMIHAGPPIQTLDGETVLLANGLSRTFIPGIEDTLRTAFDSDNLLQSASDPPDPACRVGIGGE